MKIPDHVIDAALAEANKKLREVSERISNEVAQMTKFKVGDRVTIACTITGVDERSGQVEVELEHEAGTYWFEQQTITPCKDTVFRDQATIAALQGLLAGNGSAYEYSTSAEMAFAIADALDAERKKRDGGE